MIAPGEEKDFSEARPGDHLFCPFECDYCAFFRLRGALPIEGREDDERLLAYIRRANLDAFWSRRPGTVHNLASLFSEQIAVGESFGFDMFAPIGPLPFNYDSGLKAAIGILWRSKRPGLHETNMKYSSVRKARSLHTDLYNASARHLENAMTWRSEKARFTSTKAPTETEWFNRFMTGFKARVGERRKQDAAISIEVMKALQTSLEEDWEEVVVMKDLSLQRRIAEHAAYYLLLYCGSLRGFEGPKANLGYTRKQIVRPGEINSSTVPHIGLALTGRFKARSQHSQTILIHIAYETASGLKPGVWTERLFDLLASQGITDGWVFQDADSEQLKMSYFEEDFYDRLGRIYQHQPHLFTEGINITEDFHLARSFRRGATTRATAAGVSSEDIDYINRWNIGSDASISGPMRVLYSDKRQLIHAFLRFSLAL
jgi:hypothetical protein